MLQSIKKCINTSDHHYALSVVIPTWNNLPYLKVCLDSLRRHSMLDLQIIVFVNEGVDGTAAWIKDQVDIDFVQARKNVGICYALNLSRSLVKAEHIVYLNDDMYVLPGWDVALYEEINAMSHQAFMLSATMIEPVDHGNPCVVVQNYGDSLETFQEKELIRDCKDFAVPDWSGSTWPPNVVHRDLWDLVGGLSIEFSPGMYSDPDFSRKLYHAGVRHFRGVGRSLVYHFGSKSTKKLSRSQGRELFLTKWGTTASAFCQQVLKRGQPFADTSVREVAPTPTWQDKIKLLWSCLRR